MCGFKKDRFYLYQSQWTDDPMIHLLPSWNWEGREGELTPVYIYSNCAEVELFVNEKSMGRKQKQEGIYRYIWDEIIYQPGSINAVGYGTGGEILSEKEIRTAGQPSKIGLEADRTSIQSDGRDLAFVKVKILDEDGNICPNATNLVQFSVEGEGILECVGNGDPTCIESYQASERSAFHGLCLLVVRSTQNTGEIKIRAYSKGITDAIIEISSDKLTKL
jgi:beta-galactosidase